MRRRGAARSHLRWIIVQADLFVLPREPGPFGQNVVQRPHFDQLLALLVNKRSLKDRKLSGC